MNFATRKFGVGSLVCYSSEGRAGPLTSRQLGLGIVVRTYDRVAGVWWADGHGTRTVPYTALVLLEP